jgi:Type ISP C-terminal specificity domain
LVVRYSPAYLSDHTDGIRQDWPRIPLPSSKAVLTASAELGKQVAALLDAETGVDGITAGKVRSDLVKIAIVTRLTKDTLNLSVTAGWGYANKKGAIMPGKGKIGSSKSEAKPDENPAWCEFHDVYLNEAVCWKNIPVPVWDYTIGGYQVIKKWLSYREFELLGRALTPDEAREVTHMARRIAALILLQPELDKNYEAVKAAAVPL